MQAPVTPEKPEIPWLKNLSSCLNYVRGEGYKEDFRVVEGQLRPYDNRKGYGPEQIRIINFYRFEGQSDPGDNSVLYVIETDDGTKGTLVDGFGAYAAEEVSAFIVEVDSIQKMDTTHGSS
jgi:hypothetical protein